jgi:hypothetical protein
VGKLRKAYRGIPLWLLTTVLTAVIGIVAAGCIIGTVRMPWQVVPPPAYMTPREDTLTIGTLYFGETKTGGTVIPNGLTVNEAVNITVSLGGDYSGFTELSIVVRFIQYEMRDTVGVAKIKYTATLDLLTTSATIKNVQPGTYFVFVDYKVTAGSTEGSSEAILYISIPKPS